MIASNQSKIEKQLADLQEEFKRTLQSKVDMIEELCLLIVSGKADETTIFDCHQKAHTMVGAGGTFGAIRISNIARELEQTLKPYVNQKLLAEDINLKIKEQILNLKQIAKNWQPSKIPYIKPLEEDNEDEDDNGVNKLIYLVDNDELFAKDLKLKLEQSKNSFTIKHFLNISDFIDAFYNKKPNAIIMDLVFCDGNIAGADAISQLAKEYEHVPPVIFISVRTDIEARLASSKAGAQRYFCKPLDVPKLSKTLLDLIQPTKIVPYRILLIDDDISLLRFYKTVLTGVGMEVKTLSNPMDAIKTLDNFKADVIVLDVYMPECSGPEIAKIIRQDDALSFIPIMFLSIESDIDMQLYAMNLGGESFSLKPISAEHLISTITTKAKRSRSTNKINADLKYALRESEFQLITSDQHNIVSEADVSGRIISVNNKFCEISGFTREELLGENHRILKSNYHSEKFYELMWKEISNGNIWQGLICNLNKSGQEYWVNATIVPFLDEKGKPYKYVSARTDVTLTIQSEVRLERSQIFANIGTWDWNIKTGDLYWSDRIWPLFGYEKEGTKTSYDNFMLAIHPDDRQKVTDAITECVENEIDYNIEHRVIWPNGNIRWLKENGNVIRDKNNQAIQMLGVVQDITDEKNAKLAIQASKKKLLESEERLNFAVAGAGDGIWDWDMKTNAVNFSPLWMNMLGYQENEFPYTFDTFADLVHADDLCAVQQELQDYLSKNKEYYNIELRLRCKDGSYKWVLSRGQVVAFDNDGTALRMIGIHSDINSLKENEENLILLRKEAEDANHSKSQFLSSMSHELRTPMNAIMGFGQLLELDIENNLSVSQKENIEEILKASNHLLDLINEVLDLAQIEAGKLNLSIESVLLVDIVMESLQLILPLAEKRGISIKIFYGEKEVDYADEIMRNIFIRADYTRIKQVFINLLSNAVKYNKKNGLIKIECCFVENNVRVSISDTGIGLNSEQKEKLFMAFNRLGVENSDIEGTGIGLVITKELVEKMGGKIGAESEENKGSTFWFELPSASVESNDDSKEALLVEDEILRKDEFSILYIEDNPANLRLVSQLFEQLPQVNMWSAHEPLLGLDLAAEHIPDLILLDINLPTMDGFEVLKILRQDEATKNIPVIAISANAMKNDIQNGLDAGFDDYVTKPINIKELLVVVEKQLDK